MKKSVFESKEESLGESLVVKGITWRKIMVVKVNPNLNQSSEFKEETPCEKLPKYKEKEKKKASIYFQWRDSCE